MTTTTLIGRFGPRVTRAIEKLQTLAIGDSVPVAAMSEALGEDCATQGAGRTAIGTAINYIRVNMRMNITWDRNTKSWKRTNDSESSTMCRGDIARASRATKRGLQRTACVDRKSLSEEEKAEFEATATQLAVAHIGLSDETRKALPKGETTVDTQRLLLSIRQIS